VKREDTLDQYEAYAELYEQRWGDRRDERRTKPKYNSISERMREQITAELTDGLEDTELGFHPTYRPSRHEQGWLLSSLRSFYDQGLISDVLARVKGGKEANVYLCVGADRLLAAKVYRPRMFRNLRNDALYRQGRPVMVVGGKAAGKAASTLARAIRNKTPYGMEAAHVSWLMHEYAALDRLHRAGADVPQPMAANENAVLMDYCGDELQAAPTLSSVDLEALEAFAVQQRILRNVELMMEQGLVHGDLSAYNILYWKGEITLIDFPQVIDLHANSDARWILRRDLERIGEYLALQGLRFQPRAVADDLWHRYVGELRDQDLLAEWSRLLPEDQEMEFTG
jgi:RIO kinase 1